MPKFNRVSLIGSEELFRPTRAETQAAEEAVEAAEETAETLVSHRRPVAETQPPAPLPRERAVYRLQLSEEQVRMLVDAVQLMKYPHKVKVDQKPSIEEFEALEALKANLLDVLD